MAIQGNLETMKLQELLRWARDHSETGLLEIERNKVCKRIAFRCGRIVGCSSDDPPARIGQFLLSRGKISRDALARALEFQKENRGTLGEILQDMGEIEAEELAYEMTAKAEENILGLFDWQNAVFRFKSGENTDPWMLDVSMSVDHAIERGTERSEQLHVIRRLVVSSGVVLERSGTHIPPEIYNNALARRILDTIDGEKTIAEVLLHAHASEFLVLKFIASTIYSGYVNIAMVREVNPQYPTLLDDEGTAGPQTQVTEEALPELRVPAPQPEFEERLELAQHFLAQGEAEAALQILDECYEQRPGDEYLNHLNQKAEAAFIKACREGDLRGERVPVRTSTELIDSSGAVFGAAERFLLGMIDDGRHTIQVLLWIAPMREIDIFRALARMHQARVIELRDDSNPAVDGVVPAIHWA